MNQTGWAMDASKDNDIIGGLKERIEQKIDDKGTSMAEISRKIEGGGIDYVSSFIRKVKGKSIRSLMYIATALDCTVNDLMYKKNDIRLISNTPNPIDVELLNDCFQSIKVACEEMDVTIYGEPLIEVLVLSYNNAIKNKDLQPNRRVIKKLIKEQLMVVG